MDIHEYQTKLVLSTYGIPSPPFEIITTLDELLPALEKLNLSEGILKVQVLAGGRGKAGGVKIFHNPNEAEDLAKQMLGMKIVNQQTGKRGLIAHKLMVTPLVSIKKEYYLGAVLDRKTAQGILIASPFGGVEIEEVAQKTPEKILRVPIPLNGKLQDYHLIEICKFMGWQDSLKEQAYNFISVLTQAFVQTDASLLEINPLVETEFEQLIALDAKLSVDDNALFRQPLISSFYDPTQYLPNEVLAKQYDLAYIGLDGNIGCMVNGAGLAMATMDLIHHYGGQPANFLDVGGGASEEKIAQGFKILLLDPLVKVIFVNIFGGIMNCETLAKGIISAVDTLKISTPLVVRMEGTNVEEGKKILQNAMLNIQIFESLSDAAQTVVKMAMD